MLSETDSYYSDKPPIAEHEHVFNKKKKKFFEFVLSNCE